MFMFHVLTILIVSLLIYKIQTLNHLLITQILNKYLIQILLLFQLDKKKLNKQTSFTYTNVYYILIN